LEIKDTISLGIIEFLTNPHSHDYNGMCGYDENFNCGINSSGCGKVAPEVWLRVILHLFEIGFENKGSCGFHVSFSFLENSPLDVFITASTPFFLTNVMNRNTLEWAFIICWDGMFKNSSTFYVIKLSVHFLTTNSPLAITFAANVMRNLFVAIFLPTIGSPFADVTGTCFPSISDWSRVGHNI